MTDSHQDVRRWWDSLSGEAQAKEHSQSRYFHIPFEVYTRFPVLIKRRWLVAMKEEKDGT